MTISKLLHELIGGNEPTSQMGYSNSERNLLRAELRAKIPETEAKLRELIEKALPEKRYTRRYLMNDGTHKYEYSIRDKCYNQAIDDTLNNLKDKHE